MGPCAVLPPSAAQPTWSPLTFSQHPPSATSQHFHTVRVLGLIPFPNHNFPRGFCQLDVDFVGFLIFLKNKRIMGSALMTNSCGR